MTRVVLVTGGTSGIGAAIARRLAAAGAYVAAGYWGFEERAQLWLKEMTEQFPDNRFSLHEGNVGVADDCRRVIAGIIDQYGQLDVLVAGITIDRTVAKMTDSDWQTVLDVDLSGAYYLSQPALAHMVERGRGRIVSISSVIGEMGNIGQANYAAAKAGLFGLTKSLAREAAFQLKRSGRLDGGVGVKSISGEYPLDRAVGHRRGDVRMPTTRVGWDPQPTGHEGTSSSDANRDRGR